ncbi:hypothetical protein HK100_011088 [Physocladia obscura]|uniref:DUF1294-domain-containing protein n=1 Tax=Physocladia obscura TaxID=109957 RepID=A0AAD5T4E5_9FUNG|nr:hypothetical protein HK100_011088 [Physocladia obscura]
MYRIVNKLDVFGRQLLSVSKNRAFLAVTPNVLRFQKWEIPTAYFAITAAKTPISLRTYHQHHPSLQQYRNRNQRQKQNNQQEQERQNQNQHEATISSQPLLLAVTGYLILINGFAVALFWYDKNQALKGGWRIPEKQLQATALFGGWVGGIWAMKTFKHKTVKKAFQEPYMFAVAGNCMIFAGLAVGWVFLPGIRRSANGFVRTLIR